MWVFNDEMEIEDWFQTQKQQLDERLYKAAMKQKSGPAKQQYDKEFTRLLKRYEKHHLDLMKRQQRRERLRTPFDRYLTWRKERLLRLRKWWKQRKASFKKWRFEREYTRLMKK